MQRETFKNFVVLSFVLSSAALYFEFHRRTYRHDILTTEELFGEQRNAFYIPSTVRP
jgi:hypothetical protein